MFLCSFIQIQTRRSWGKDSVVRVFPVEEKEAYVGRVVDVGGDFRDVLKMCWEQEDKQRSDNVMFQKFHRYSNVLLPISDEHVVVKIKIPIKFGMSVSRDGAYVVPNYKKQKL